MELMQRFFQLDTEWCAVHVPERPNGFGIIVLGDKNHFVEEETSFLIQNQGRLQMLTELINQGYTVFYSNLYGRHWGSKNAVLLARRLYHYIMKNEILNDRIHILAEGMGALVGLQLAETMNDHIRTVALINPCIDLKAHIEHEEDYKFFYKQLIKELARAYKIDEKIAIQEIIENLPKINFETEIPLAIWQTTDRKGFNPEFHTRMLEEQRKRLGKPILISYLVAEKKHQITGAICRFFKQHEEKL
jgi:pimeloyl-ACP methyl ester carboxylesterase